MDARITGSFPGGPRRSGEEDGPRRAPHLRSVEEFEDARAARTLRRALGRRGRSRLVLLLALTVGFGVGAALGLATRTTPGRLTDALDAERERDAEISREVNRVLLELWKMEDVEALRGAGPRR